MLKGNPTRIEAASVIAGSGLQNAYKAVIRAWADLPEPQIRPGRALP
jgi:hypothetical protein